MSDTPLQVFRQILADAQKHCQYSANYIAIVENALKFTSQTDSPNTD